ncbi:DUF2357 domain-containing protein [Streptomyces niger]|uniref:DUF2357 domain-containing protein n=1 Tax=Streptomyces niger TaxID=66373 RepID=UPI000A8F21AA|nr:DUF2357 domain-containing protein [Streptomyces niger]
MTREASEPESDSALVRHLLALSSRLTEEATGLNDWLAMPPIILDVSDETEALPVEEAFERESGALRTVCHRPYMRLRTAQEVLPISRVRSIAAGAAARLAAHPEDWVSHTLAGVRPGRLLARRNEEDADIYENRVAVAVLNVMRSHLQQRIAKLRDLRKMVSDVHGLLMSSEESSWRTRRNLTGLLRNVEDSSRHHEAAQVRLRELESSLAAVEVMLNSPLARAVDHRSVPPRELHPTNLFSSDLHYRRVAVLWQACTAIEAVRPRAAETDRRHQEVRTAFERFTGLLLMLACRLLQAIPDADQPAPCPGRTSRFRMRGTSLTVTWAQSGEFTVHWRGRSVLRVVPVPADLCTAPDAASVAAFIADVRRNRPLAEGESDLIVYPGALLSRQNADPRVLQAAYRVGHRHGDAVGQPAGVAPLSPLDIFSVSRLMRAIQWATLGADAGCYPYTVSMAAGERSALAACSWLEPHSDGVAVVRPPRPEELEELPRLLKGNRVRRGGGRAAEHEAQRLRTVRVELEDAAAQTELLAVCPICAKTGTQRQTVFEPRENGLFAAACFSCRTRWELRRCLACSSTFPLLDMDGLAAAGASEPHLDRRLGGVFLAAPCWAESGTGHAICPACGTCGQEPRVASCPRGCPVREPS